MRLNRYLASATGMSRRAADKAIAEGRVAINGRLVELGPSVQTYHTVTLDGRVITPAVKTTTIMLNKPVGYVCSREGQGSKTIYDLLPAEYHELKPVGRLDKDSSGLLLLTNDGDLAHQLTHPSFQKEKVYEVELNMPLTSADKIKLQKGILLDDGVSKLDIRRWTLDDGKVPNVQRPSSHVYRVAMREGRNRQIRRTFDALGYAVTKLHRTHFGPYTLGSLRQGDTLEITK
jgi:23S rRNA pseudouridine2605 synthase